MANAMAYLNEYLYNDLIGIVNNYLMPNIKEVVTSMCLYNTHIKTLIKCAMCKQIYIDKYTKGYCTPRRLYHQKCILRHYNNTIDIRISDELLQKVDEKDGHKYVKTVICYDNIIMLTIIDPETNIPYFVLSPPENGYKSKILLNRIRYAKMVHGVCQ
jgi:hypothetical protein